MSPSLFFGITRDFLFFRRFPAFVLVVALLFTIEAEVIMLSIAHSVPAVVLVLVFVFGSFKSLLSCEVNLFTVLLVFI